MYFLAQQPKIERFVIDGGNRHTGVPLLLVESVELLEKIHLGTRRSLDRIQPLEAGLEPESLQVEWCEEGMALRIPDATGASCRREKPQIRTSVSVTKGMFHPTGGTILHIPYRFPESDNDEIYAIGSFHCSGVGWKVGQSVRPNGRGPDLGPVGLVLGVLTVSKSSREGTDIGGPSRSCMQMPPSSVIESLRASSPSVVCAWDCRAARASVLDFLGALLVLSVEDGRSLLVEAWSGRSIGIAPSTAMLRHEVKVAGALMEKSGGTMAGAGLLGTVRGERPLRAAPPRGEGEPCIVAVEKEREETHSRRLALICARTAVLQPRRFSVGTRLLRGVQLYAPILPPLDRWTHSHIHNPSCCSSCRVCHPLCTVWGAGTGHLQLRGPPH